MNWFWLSVQFLCVYFQVIKVGQCLLFEGDIAVSKAYSDLSEVRNSFLKDQRKLWKGGIIPYMFQELSLAGGGFEPLFSVADQKTIKEALNHIMEKVPCLLFREVAKGTLGAKLIFTSNGDDNPNNDPNACWSYVGKHGSVGGASGQSINLSRGCVNMGRVLHEVLHSLGATHEQNREDRDTYVRILWNNIKQDMAPNFDKQGSTFSSHGTPYDYNSVMHYNLGDFGINGKKTIQIIDKTKSISPLNERQELSPIDVFELAKVYQNLTDKQCFKLETVLSYTTFLEKHVDALEKENIKKGVSKPSSLLVYQDFLAEIRLPYSVKRGETFPMNVTIFNNIEQEVPIRVKLITSQEDIYSEKSEFEICVGPTDNKVITIKSTALNLGELDITVEAKITNGIKECKNVPEDGFTDALVGKLRVKPKGVPIEKVESDFKCFESGKEKFEMSKLEVPTDAVPDSKRAWVYVTGDIMAPALENVGNLVRLPTGCGEQNMVGLVPNIYLLQYLNSTNQEEPELERKAKEFMEIGYNRQQKYSHPDGAYSIWGDKGVRDGSTWLTAFVVKSFSEASQYIKVDTNLLQRSVNWLMNGQMRNGCFRKRGYVHSSFLQGGGSDSSLTPFVVTALLEAKSRIGVKIEPNSLDKAVDCMLRNSDTSDIYTAIVTAHAGNMLAAKLKMKTEDRRKDLGDIKMTAERKGKIDRLMLEIIRKANTSEGSTFWDNERKLSRWGHYYTSSEAVEMTAYNVMSFTLRDEVPEAINSVKWLARQRNSQGGFVSTQDTVVALQALSMYAQRVTRIPLAMAVDITEEHETTNKLNTFTMNEKNSLLLQTEKLTKLPSKLVVDTSGAGCAMVQTVLRYNMPVVPENNGFTITAQGNTNTGDNPILTICTAYTGAKKKTGMVLMEVELLTGWEAVSPESLMNEVDSGVQRVEQDEKENKVVLYFDYMHREEKCIDLELKQVMTIENAKEALITVYDYSNTEESASQLYSFN